MDQSLGRFRMGVVIRDSNGKCVAARVVTRYGCVDPTGAEG
jgi:hypothetical protein